MDKGEKYDKIRKTTMVAFVGGNLLDDEDIYHEVFGIIGEKSRRRLSGNLRFHLIEIDKVDKSVAVSEMTALERVALYFRYANDPNSEELLSQLIDSGEEAIILAEKMFRELTADEIAYEKMLARQKLLWKYGSGLSAAREQGLEEGRKEGRKEGLEQGLEQGRLEMAKAMRAENEPVEKIIKYTGLTAEEIENI